MFYCGRFQTFILSLLISTAILTCIYAAPRDFRLTEDLEDIVDELEKEYLAKLKVLQDLKAEKDIIERRLKSRTAAIINLKEDRLLLVQKKKLKEQSIEEINQSLELDNQQEIKQLEFTLEELSRSVEDMEIKYQTTLDELENLKQAVETDGMQRISYALGSISSCQFSVGSMVANILFLIKIVFHACDGISSNITFVLRILGIFENWLSFLQAVLSSWLFLSISLLIALILKRFFNLLTSDLSTSFSFDILLILVFFQWKAEPTKDALALSMHWGLLSWIVFLLLFCSLLNGIRQFCYNSLCSFRDVMDIAGRIAVLLSFLGSCGNIPQSSITKLAWITIILFDKQMKQGNRKLIHLFRKYFGLLWNGNVHSSFSSILPIILLLQKFP